MSNMDRFSRALKSAAEALEELARSANLPYSLAQYVPSSDGSTAYFVSWQLTCTCEGYKYRQACRHIDLVKQRGAVT